MGSSLSSDRRGSFPYITNSSLISHAPEAGKRAIVQGCLELMTSLLKNEVQIVASPKSCEASWQTS